MPLDRTQNLTESFYFDALDNRTFTKLYAIEGVSGFTINWAYDSETKCGGTLELVDSNYDYGAQHAVRIRYKAVDEDGNTDTVTLGTFLCGGMESERSHGGRTGRLTLLSPLTRWTETVLGVDWTCSKGGSALSMWYKILRSELGKDCNLWDKPEPADKAYSKTSIFQWDTSKRSALTQTADFLGGMVGLARSGNVTMPAYVAPKNRPLSYEVPVGAHSITFEGVDVTDTRQDVVSRVFARYEGTNGTGASAKKVVVFGSAQLDEDNAYSFAKRGRNVDRTLRIDQLSPQTAAEANARAAAALSRVKSPSTNYRFSSWYMPIDVGDVIRFRYQDNTDTGERIDVDGLVSTIDWSWAAGGGLKQTTNLKALRIRKGGQ